MPQQDHQMENVFMQRAFDLALMGTGLVSPNPLVGCVIVHNDRIVGEGWHRKYGEAHAEVNAIHAVSDHSILPTCKLFVNLEPCSHFGKTPPCADLIVAKKIQSVIISNLDSNPLVAGNGVRKLRENGVEVITGVLENEGRHLNRRFFAYMEKRRPYIILKWAQTADGFIARENMDSKWISNEISRQLVHRWRSEEDAILVGKQTVLHDNPKLNVRDWSGRDPVRVVIDRNLELSNSLNVFDGSQPTICYNVLRAGKRENLVYARIPDINFTEELIADLFERKVQSVIIEGGSKTLGSFINLGLWDEARIFTSPKTFGRGIAAPSITGRKIEETWVGDDRLNIFVNA